MPSLINYLLFLRITSVITLLFFNTVSAEQRPVEVNVLNYVEAKTSLHFDRVLEKGESFNQWLHNRSLVTIENKPQSSRRVNRDTLYSYAVVNISEGASFELPDADGRYLSVQIINQQHYSNRTYYEPGKYLLSVEEFDTPYVILVARTLVDGSDADDLKLAHGLQNKLSVSSKSDKPYVQQGYDLESLAETTEKLLSLADALPDANQCFGKKDKVDPVRHLLATAYGWGGLPETEATYLNVHPKLPVGAYSLTVKDVPVDGFWSISIYNQDGFFEKNADDIYSVNNLTARPNSDGSVTVNFGGDSANFNRLPITDGWNYVIRMYRPKQSLLDGAWVFPRAE